jgi:hypothetical protein
MPEKQLYLYSNFNRLITKIENVGSLEKKNAISVLGDMPPVVKIYSFFAGWGAGLSETKDQNDE